MAVYVFNGVVQINQIRNNSYFNQGKTVADGYGYYAKVNLSTGQVAGSANIFPSGVNIIYDSDFMDIPMPNAGALSPSLGSIREVF